MLIALGRSYPLGILSETFGSIGEARQTAFSLGERYNGPNTLQMNPQYYSSPPADHRLFAPYFAHPKFYKAGLHKVVHDMRERARNVRIFFAGTNSVSAYSEKFRFPILSRDKILRHLIQKFEWAIKRLK